MLFKKLILFWGCFFLLFLGVSAQNSGIVTYGLKIGTNQDKHTPFYNGIHKRAEEGAHKLTYILKYNKTQSKFYLKRSLQNKDRDAFLAKAIATPISPIYTDNTRKIKLYHNIGPIGQKNKFIVHDSLFAGWHLKNESKKIQGLVCYKATGILIYRESGKTKSKQIIAWYCPKIPNSFGPKGFGGLPGLILALQIDDVLFGAEKLQLRQPHIDISFPTKGKLITPKQMDSIYQKFNRPER